jgi:hypothetical protein
MEEPSSFARALRNVDCDPDGDSVSGGRVIAQYLVDQKVVPRDARYVQYVPKELRRTVEIRDIPFTGDSEVVVGVDLRERTGDVLVNSAHGYLYYCAHRQPSTNTIVLDLLQMGME